ncbi:MAG: dihydroorotate dehydrogenase electron transfer subunit [Oscillospiraceae bacterium]|jgi:dihydroorotate dehydrogenase electron transfer subunit
MSKLCRFDILENRQVAKDTYSIVLFGDCSAVTTPGQFVNIAVEGHYLRRPLSVCRASTESMTLVYKMVGSGTYRLSQREPGTGLDVLTGLGNGFDISESGKSPLLIGGGAGAAPLFWLAEKLLEAGAKPRAALGFNSADEVFLAAELAELGVPVTVSTMDGSMGARGTVTDTVRRIGLKYDYIFACGPEPMLRAAYYLSEADGQYSFEERMACGFGACMCCSCETKYGPKRICKEGPVLKKGEIKW